jgi:hypothetical protein
MKMTKNYIFMLYKIYNWVFEANEENEENQEEAPKNVTSSEA